VTDTNVLKLVQPGTFCDLLTDVLRSGAHALLAQAVEAEVASFLAANAHLQTEDGRQRLVRPASGSGCRVTRRSASRLTNKTASTKKPRLARRTVPVAVISLTIKPWASAPESHSKSVEPICCAGNHRPASTLERVLKVRQAIPAVNVGGRMSATTEHVSLRLTDSGKQCSWQCRRARSSRAAEEQSSVSVRTSFVIVRVVTSLRCSPP
jgi:hypothetical protein